MNQAIYLVETRPKEVSLTEKQARAVASLGKALASKSIWWGSETDTTADETATVISCTPKGETTWNIQVSNAIGAFGIDELTFVVVPKIPTLHVLYIMAHGDLLPRTDGAPVLLANDIDLLELIARWFVERTTRMISSDLIWDYQKFYGRVSSVRGKIDALQTAANYYAGSLDVMCSYDDFSIDNAYNRVLLAALGALQFGLHMNRGIRRDSRRLSTHFAGVGSLSSRDLDVLTDRRSAHYHDALLLAKLILSAKSVSIEEGSARAWSFLIRTPEAIEAGIRTILRAHLAPEVQVLKRRIALNPKEVVIEPDLCFDPRGLVGDVKYKLYGADWPRSDLYQSVAFAAGAGSPRACVISFGSAPSGVLPAVRFGNIEVSHLVWDAGKEANPADSALQLIADCKDWLSQ